MKKMLMVMMRILLEKTLVKKLIQAKKIMKMKKYRTSLYKMVKRMKKIKIMHLVKMLQQMKLHKSKKKAKRRHFKGLSKKRMGKYFYIVLKILSLMSYNGFLQRSAVRLRNDAGEE